MNVPIAILVVSDSAEDGHVLAGRLREGGFCPDYTKVQTVESLSIALDSRAWDAIIVRYSIPEISGKAVLDLVREKGKDSPVIIVAEESEKDWFAPMLKLGAKDFLLTTELFRLSSVIERELRQLRSRRQAQQSPASAGLEAFVQSSPDGIFFVSADGAIAFVNIAAQKLLGYVSAEMLGRQFTMLMPPRLSEAQFATINEFTKAPGRCAFIGRHKDGREISLDCSCTGFSLGSGGFLALTVREIGKPAAVGLPCGEIRYRKIFESTQDAVFLMREDRFVDCNEATLRIFGCLREQIIGQSPVRFSPALQPDGQESLPEAKQKIDAALGGVPQRFEWRHCRYDGTEFDAEVSLDSFEENGQAMLLAIVRDITERKRAGQELAAAEAKYRSLVENTSDWVWEVDAEGRYTYCSPKVKELLGYDPEDILGRTPFDFMVPDDITPVRNAFKDCVQNQTRIVSLRNAVFRKDKTRIMLETSGEPIIEGRRLVGYRGIDRDITERERAETALRLANERICAMHDELDHFFTVTLDLLCIADKDGNFRRLNAAWERTLGYSGEELTSGRFLDFVHPDDILETREALSALVSQRESVGFVNRFRCKDSTYRWLEWRSVRAGNLLYAAARDITKRREAQEQLRALNITLERRIAERTAQLRVLAERLTQTEHRERRRIAHFLHEHFQQLIVGARMQLLVVRNKLKDEALIPTVDTVNQILAQAIEASRSLAVELSPPILHGLGLVPALHWLGRKTEEKYHLVVDVYADPAAEPTGDDVKGLLFEIVSELLFNVVKHAKAASAAVRLAPAADGQIELVISDRGVGFDPEELKNFQPAGGLGLFSVGERVEWLGGTLQVDSTPGQGTRITIRVPLR